MLRREWRLHHLDSRASETSHSAQSGKKKHIRIEAAEGQRCMCAKLHLQKVLTTVTLRVVGCRVRL